MSKPTSGVNWSTKQGINRDTFAIRPAYSPEFGPAQGKRALRNDPGEFRGHIRIARIMPGRVLVEWPEQAVKRSRIKGQKYRPNKKGRTWWARPVMHDVVLFRVL
jgi:hypothetical protein